MKTFQSPIVHITYPYESKITYKEKHPFIRIITNTAVYYGFENKQLQLVQLNIKPNHTIVILNKYHIPNDQENLIFFNTTQKLKGITYKLLYVHENQYVCLGTINSIYVSFVVITIDLNSKGYFEIENIQNILKYI